MNHPISIQGFDNRLDLRKWSAFNLSIRSLQNKPFFCRINTRQDYVSTRPYTFQVHADQFIKIFQYNIKGWQSLAPSNEFRRWKSED
jgi:hypothetical protein